MTDARQIHNLALIGFMGSGKTSVAHLLAGWLHYRFIDTDQWIEDRAGQRIPDIFATAGESQFRAYEREAVEALTHVRSAVIATGGGLASNGDCLQKLKEHSVVFCLWASPESIFQRVRYQSNRPLLQTPDPLATIRRLLAARESMYRQADVLISTESRSVREVALQILHQFQAMRRKVNAL